MTRQRLQPVIDAVVTPLLAAGFKKRQRLNTGFRFKKKRSIDDPIVAAIGPAYTWRMNEDVLGAFIAKTWYGWHLAPIYGVRHEGIMRFVEEASIDLDGCDGLFKPKAIEGIFKPTLTCYTYLVGRQPGRPYPNVMREWMFVAPKDTPRYVPRIQTAIRRIVLPYMRRCQTLEGIVAEMLKDEDRTRSFVPIAAGLHLLGRNDEAFDFLRRQLPRHSRASYHNHEMQEEMDRSLRQYARWLIDRMRASGWKAPQRRMKAIERLLQERKVGSRRRSTRGR